MVTVTEVAGARRVARPVRRRRVKAAPYLFVAPFVLVFAAFSAYPIFFALQLSFTNWHGAGVLEFIGLANYRYLLASPDFWQSMATSGALWLLVVPAQVLLALTIAVALRVLWRTTGYAVILLMAGLSSIPSDVYEAARIDGAGAWHQLWSITVPLVTRTLSFVVVIGTLTVFQLFAEPYVVTGGGPFNG